jgi:hypothetical protein
VQLDVSDPAMEEFVLNVLNAHIALRGCAGEHQRAGDKKQHDGDAKRREWFQKFLERGIQSNSGYEFRGTGILPVIGVAQASSL